MSNYQPIIYVWLEVPRPPGTQPESSLANFLGGDVRPGTGEIRCHIWLSDDDVIPYREPIPADLPFDLPSLRELADEIRRRILAHVKRIMDIRIACGLDKTRLKLDRMLLDDGAKAELDQILDETNEKHD